jgi:hypothetical protein
MNLPLPVATMEWAASKSRSTLISDTFFQVGVNLHFETGLLCTGCRQRKQKYLTSYFNGIVAAQDKPQLGDFASRQFNIAQ